MHIKTRVTKCIPQVSRVSDYQVQIRKQPAVNMLSKHTVHVELREAIRSVAYRSGHLAVLLYLLYS